MKIIRYCIFFITGFLSCALVLYAFPSGNESPSGGIISNVSAPADFVAGSNIHVYENSVVIDIENASISKYAATGSMIPVLNENSNGIRIFPNSEEDIPRGDIITFKRGEDLIVHRVIKEGNDELGEWFITKGDNSPAEDGKIYFSDIRYVTIGILY
jgi:signal peptidase I